VLMVVQKAQLGESKLKLTLYVTAEVASAIK
jgi:hypothetical protein